MLSHIGKSPHLLHSLEPTLMSQSATRGSRLSRPLSVVGLVGYYPPNYHDRNIPYSEARTEVPFSVVPLHEVPFMTVYDQFPRIIRLPGVN